MENSETGVWLDFAYECKYIFEDHYKDLSDKNEEIGKLLNHILRYPERY